MNTKPKAQKGISDLSKALLALSVLIEILLWARINLKYQYIFDYDASKLFYHVICMWREKTLLIPNWVYMTTGEWDCASLPALLFYGLTQDIKLSFGLANVCNILLFTLVISRVFQAVPLQHGRVKAMLLAVCLLLMPYCWGMLDYSNMLFYGGAQYIYKVLLPVWLISLYVGMPSGRMASVLYTSAFLLLVFATASSSGLYVLLCGFMPILCCRFIRALSIPDARRDSRGLLISAMTVAVFLAGFAFQRAVHLETKVNEMMLIPLEILWRNLSRVIEDFLKIIQPLPKEVFLQMFSPKAWISYIKIGMLLIMLILGTGELSRCFLLKDGFSGSGQISDEAFCRASLGSVFVWNLVVMVLLGSTTRYHLIGFIPFMLLSCMVLTQRLEACPADRLKCFLWTGIAGMVILLAALLFLDAREHVSIENENYSRVVISEAEALDVQTVVVLDDGWLVEQIRPLDPDRDYVTYFSSEQKLVNYDVPASLNDMGLLEKRHMLVTQDRYPFELLPESLQQRYTLIKDEWHSQYYLAEPVHD